MKAAQRSRPTLGLAMIMEDEIKDLDRIVHDYGKFFDKVYVTVTDRQTYATLRKRFPKKSETDSLVQLSYFKWIDHFGKARQYNQRQIKTDYWMWLDTDDEIEGVENVPQVIEYMVSNNLDAVWFQYDYVPRVNFSDPKAILWRERIIRTDSGLEWKNKAVHETVNVHSGIRDESLEQIMIKHRKTAEQIPASLTRNKFILEKEWQRTRRASTAWYLGASLKQTGDYEGAIEKLLYATEHSKDWALKFLALQNLCECYYQTGKYDAALAVANKRGAMDPDHPGHWYQKFSIYKAMGDLDSAMQSAEIAMVKRVEGRRENIVGHDPTLYQYRGPFAVAQVYLSTGNIERAYQIYSEVKKTAPKYIEEQSTAAGIQWNTIFEQAYSENVG